MSPPISLQPLSARPQTLPNAGTLEGQQPVSQNGAAAAGEIHRNVPGPDQSAAHVKANRTPPRMPLAFQGAAGGQSAQGSGDAGSLSRIDLDSVSNANRTANQAGVNMAKTSFWRRVGGAVVVGLAAAAMIGLGVATGGVAMLAVGAVTAAAGLRLSADAYMAKLHLENARSEASGQGLVHDLPMGTDAIAHGLYKLCPNTWSQDARAKVARWGSFLADAAVAAGTVLATGGVSAVTLGVAGTAVTITGANHLVLARLRQVPSATEVLLGQAQLPQKERGPDTYAIESTPPDRAGLDDRAIHHLAEIEILARRAEDLPPGQERDQLNQDRQALEQKVQASFKLVSEKLGAIEVMAQGKSQAPREGAMGAVLVASVMSVNTGTRIGLSAGGVPAVTFASSIMELGMNMLALNQRKGELPMLEGLNSAYGEQLGELRRHQMGLMIKNTDQDEDDFELVFDQPAQGSNMVLPGQLA